MRKNVFFIVMFLACTCWAHAKPYTVVIDAGHGGKDAGAVGRVLKVQEKTLNLEVSLRLASKIRTAYPEVNVVLTRSSDVFLPLQQRADIVNKNNADLFICIHTNAAEGRSAQGAETFILGTERMEDNLDVAMRENAVMKLEADYKTAYQGFDPNSIDSYIMFELMQNQYMDQSLQFASLVQTGMVRDLKRGDRGVRQAAFWVLLKSACPSILFEMGFISNKDEEQYLASDQGKKEVTETLFQAFSKYYSGVQSTPAEPKVTPVDEQKQDSQIEPKSEKETKKENAKPNRKNKEQDAPSVAPEKPQITTPEKVEEPKPVEPVTQAQVPVYKVQIFATQTILPEGDPQFKGLKGCTYTQRDVWYKYMYGNCQTKEEASQLCKELSKKFPGCFVVLVN